MIAFFYVMIIWLDDSSVDDNFLYVMTFWLMIFFVCDDSLVDIFVRDDTLVDDIFCT